MSPDEYWWFGSPEAAASFLLGLDGIVCEVCWSREERGLFGRRDGTKRQRRRGCGRARRALERDVQSAGNKWETRKQRLSGRAQTGGGEGERPPRRASKGATDDRLVVAATFCSSDGSGLFSLVSYTATARSPR